MSSFQELLALRQKKLAGKYSSPVSMALADTPEGGAGFIIIIITISPSPSPSFNIPAILSSSIIQITIEPPGHFEAADRDGGLRDKDHQQPEVLDGQDKDEATLYSCSKCRLKVETKVRLKKNKEETHRIFQCDECDKKCSSSKD